ncbi:MAG TPA: rod shape-determining protein MreD [Gaiellaceae bacterium]|nr:rod shape-determining protein MreD [Gaiellaceae bacterium]
MTATEVLKAAGLLLAAALLQVSVLWTIEVSNGHPDLLLVYVVVLALVRGPLLGAVAGFWAGLFFDVATFSTLGISSLLLTLAGYWSGRLGSIMSTSSPHPPLIAVGFATVAVALGSTFLHFVLGSTVGMSELLGRVLLPTLALNLLLAYPVHRLVCRLFPRTLRSTRQVIVPG